MRYSTPNMHVNTTAQPHNGGGWVHKFFPHVWGWARKICPCIWGGAWTFLLSQNISARPSTSWPQLLTNPKPTRGGGLPYKNAYIYPRVSFLRSLSGCFFHKMVPPRVYLCQILVPNRLLISPIVTYKVCI